VEPGRSTQISTQVRGLTMAYTERRERRKGTRFRGIYKGADGHYRSAGTFSGEARALEVAEEAERHAAEVAAVTCSAGSWWAAGGRPGCSVRMRRSVRRAGSTPSRWSGGSIQLPPFVPPKPPDWVREAAVRRVRGCGRIVAVGAAEPADQLRVPGLDGGAAAGEMLDHAERDAADLPDRFPALLRPVHLTPPSRESAATCWTLTRKRTLLILRKSRATDPAETEI
jgi:hypothetical protein